jgi:undecaprenyl diphosphate synthase
MRGLPRAAGHRRGADAVRETVEGCVELGIPFLTLYAFSSENWKRPATEVEDLMGLLRHYLKRELAELDRQGVRVRFIGNIDLLDAELVGLLRHAEALTASNTRLTLIVALSYGSRMEIVAAARALASRVARGDLDVREIDEALFERHLSTAGLPDPDLLIRTSGEQRLSNFLLWQLAYTELLFVDTLWPDFAKDHLRAAVGEFRRRERRYGAIGG